MSISDDAAYASYDESLDQSKDPMYRRVIDYVKKQSGYLHAKTLLAYALCAPLPKFVGAEIRASILRMLGFDIAPRVGFYGTPTLSGWGDYTAYLKVGFNSWFNVGCYLELNAPITIGKKVRFGQEVMVLTGTHAIGPDWCRAGLLEARPVVIGDGVWLGARCVVLPGVTIGNGSVISAGTVVSRDVPPNTIMLGTQGMPLEKWMAMTKQVAGANQNGARAVASSS